jgi:hypothetical protein
MTTEPDVLYKMKVDAARPRVAPPPNSQQRRKPLGLRPVGDDVVHEADPPASEGFEDPTVALIVDSNALIVQLIEDQRRFFANKLAGLANTISALQNENQALKLILENLRITQRGERGIDVDRGPPGRDGRDGLQGAIGPRGERGEQGPPAPRLSAWEAHPERFEVVPVFSTGERGPAISLLALFQAYDSAVQELEDRDLVSAAADSRRAAEDAAEASRWAMR